MGTATHKPILSHNDNFISKRHFIKHEEVSGYQHFIQFHEETASKIPLSYIYFQPQVHGIHKQLPDLLFTNIFPLKDFIFCQIA